MKAAQVISSALNYIGICVFGNIVPYHLAVFNLFTSRVASSRAAMSSSMKYIRSYGRGNFEIVRMITTFVFD